jgi:hypothetical protein
MTDVLQHVYEYRRLLARSELLGRKLDAPSRARLEALGKLFAAEASEPHRRRHSRCDVHVRATVKAGGRIHAVHIVNIGGGGMCVVPAPQLRQGERAVVKVVSARGELHYPVQAQWVARNEAGSAMGMPFVGAPLQVPR